MCRPEPPLSDSPYPGRGSKRLTRASSASGCQPPATVRDTTRDGGLIRPAGGARRVRVGDPRGCSEAGRRPEPPPAPQGPAPRRSRWVRGTARGHLGRQPAPPPGPARPGRPRGGGRSRPPVRDNAVCAGSSTSPGHLPVRAGSWGLLGSRAQAGIEPVCRAPPPRRSGRLPAPGPGPARTAPEPRPRERRRQPTAGTGQRGAASAGGQQQTPTQPKPSPPRPPQASDRSKPSPVRPAEPAAGDPAAPVSRRCRPGPCCPAPARVRTTWAARRGRAP